MSYKFELKLNLGNYQSVMFGVDNCDTMAEAKAIVLRHVKDTAVVLDRHAMKVFERGK